MERKVGQVTHFFAGPSAAVLRLSADLKVGDRIHITGATTDFMETVNSMQIDHNSVEHAGPGDDVAILTKDRVREGDEVFVVEGEAASTGASPARSDSMVSAGKMGTAGSTPMPNAPGMSAPAARPTMPAAPAMPAVVAPKPAPKPASKPAAKPAKKKAKKKDTSKAKTKAKGKAKPKKKDKPKSKAKAKAKSKPKAKAKAKKKKR
jgi:hypothetical protein